MYLYGGYAVYRLFRLQTDVKSDGLHARGRSLGPAVTALSAGAADMSGWLLMGLPGAMFSTGLSGAWIVLGLVLGAWANWLFVAPRLRTYTEKAGIPSPFRVSLKTVSVIIRSFSDCFRVLSFSSFHILRIIRHGIRRCLIQQHFRVELPHGTVGRDRRRCRLHLVRGFLAVSWTDFVQGIIMFVALILVPIVTIFHTGGRGNRCRYPFRQPGTV